MVLVVAGTTFYIANTNKNPLPTSIKNQVSFKIVYPAASLAKIDINSYDYQAGNKVLTYKVDFAGSSIIITQQPAPDKLGVDTQAYYPAIGIHPYAQFNTKLGTVALTKFWQSSTLKPTGQSAILATNGTMVLAHSDKDLTDQQWKSLFDSLKITK